MKQRTVTEYRVLSEREGNIVTEKRYRSLKAAKDRIGRLTSPEPWRFYGSERDRQRDGDHLMCCLGDARSECGCGGYTVREYAENERKDLPLIKSVRVERRAVTTTEWEPVEV